MAMSSLAAAALIFYTPHSVVYNRSSIYAIALYIMGTMQRFLLQ